MNAILVESVCLLERRRNFYYKEKKMHAFAILVFILSKILSLEIYVYIYLSHYNECINRNL